MHQLFDHLKRIQYFRTIFILILVVFFLLFVRSLDLKLTDFDKSLLTIISTIVLFCATQIILKWYIEPVHDLRNHIGEVANQLIYYANLYSNPAPYMSRSQAWDAGANSIRQASSVLRSRTYLIANYSFFSRIGVLPPREHLDEAATKLVGLSNSFYKGPSEDLTAPGVRSTAVSNGELVISIRKLLKIPHVE